MKYYLLILLISILLSMPGAICMAEEEKDHICFSSVDADEDGKVTFEEFKKYYGDDIAKFKTVDKDKDGNLTHDEYHEFLGHGAS